MNTNLKAWISLLFAMLFWGMSFVWTRKLLDVIPPISIVFTRMVLSSALLLLLTKVIGKLQKVDWSTLKWILLMAFFEPFLYFLLEGYGIQKTSASFAAIMMATIPLFTPFGSLVFYKEKVSVVSFVGILISFGGVILIILNQNKDLNFSLVGVFLLLGAVMTTLGYFLILPKVSAKVNVFTLTSYQNLIAIFYFLPALLLVDGVSPLVHLPMTFDVVSALLALSILASSVAFLLFNQSVRWIGPSKAAAFSNSIPVITVIFAYFILGEEITLPQLTGMALVLIGLVITQQKRWQGNGKKA